MLRKKIFHLLIIIFSFILIYYLGLEYDLNFRLYNIITQTMKEPDSIFSDISIHQRVVDVVFSINGFLINYGIPHIWGQWGEDLHIMIYGNTWADQAWISDGNRIMSGFGAALYELGIFGMIYIYIVINLHRKFYTNNIIFYRQSIFLIFLMFSSIQLANPLFSVYIGALLYLTEEINVK